MEVLWDGWSCQPGWGQEWVSRARRVSVRGVGGDGDGCVLGWMKVGWIHEEGVDRGV